MSLEEDTATAADATTVVVIAGPGVLFFEPSTGRCDAQFLGFLMLVERTNVARCLEDPVPANDFLRVTGVQCCQGVLMPSFGYRWYKPMDDLLAFHKTPAGADS